jgi:spore protease
MQNKNFSVRTDLAIEASELCEEKDGIKVLNKEFDDIKVTQVKILNQEAGEKIGKQKGTYITIECGLLKKNIINYQERVIKILANNIKKLINKNKFDNILVVGLGNWNITADSLGPKVISKILVTRHIKNILPEEIKNSVRRVSAISPGVLGITGLETFEIIKGIQEKINPDLIIIIDSLAARNVSRINSTIQITDTGITPGMGMGNKRVSLDKKSLETNIISIGVPTVIDAATLINDTMDKILVSMQKVYEKNKTQQNFFSALTDLDTQEKYNLIKQILEPYEQNMFVTPKEVDEVVERLSNIIATAINNALQDKITLTELKKIIN